MTERDGRMAGFDCGSIKQSKYVKTAKISFLKVVKLDRYLIWRIVNFETFEAGIWFRKSAY